MLLVGIFALTWKKRNTTPISFIIFEYQDEFKINQEMIIKSEDKFGFQVFTNLRYNLQKFWFEAENNRNFKNELLDSKNKFNLPIDRNLKLVLIIVVLIFLLWLYRQFMS